MSSVIKVDQIQTAAGGTPTVGGLGVSLPSTDLPAGTVLQVKHVVNSTQVVVSSGNTYVDLGLSISITPKSASSTFLLLAKVSSHLDVTTAGWGSAWFRDGVQQRHTDLEVYVSDNVASLRAVGSFQYLDSPATTSEITYEFKPRTFSSDTIKFNEAGRGESNLTVIEIAG